MKTALGVIILLALLLLLAPTLLMVSLGIVGVSVSLLEAIGLSTLMGMWLGLMTATIRSSS